MYNVISLVISLIALALSGFATIRQLRYARSASDMTLLLEVALSATRDRGFQNDQRYVLTRLREEHLPDAGMDALPEQARTATRNVAFMYEYIGIMYALDMVDSRIALGIFHFRIRQVWETLEPYIRAERVARQAPFLPFFENMYIRSQDAPAEDILRSLGLCSARGFMPEG
ncbi:hypothetical protein ACIPJS_25985 [Streptomyces sp. NPDC086783]|uniref:DUF4760 domain-containing protein n=1 Tax=Streptomyces sp. NPDC086783 TaxID=3365758 RepID=UPI0038023BE8